MSSLPRLRIAQVAPPLERVPPLGYGGTERVVYELTTELVRRGHDVTVFASADSEPPEGAALVPTVDAALRPSGFGGDQLPYFLLTQLEVLKTVDQFDLIHSHLEWSSLLLARAAPVPVLSTFHGRLDLPFARRVFADPPQGLVAVSRSQASAHPGLPWTVVYNGLTLSGAPFRQRRRDSLCFVGRVAPEKGIVDAIEVARAAGRQLRIAAKVGTLPDERAYYENVFLPALKRADVEYLGELGAADRDRLLAESFATLMPGAWPEPFGLVAIESLACGTPVIGRRVGAMPEVIRDGIDGFFGDDVSQMAFLVDHVADLDRQAIRESVVERFSASRMADGYEAAYQALLAADDAGARRPARPGRVRRLRAVPGPDT